MKIYLLRHGETAQNRDGQGLGRADVVLTTLGKAQARASAEALIGVSLEAVYSSPLGRAVATAEVLAAINRVPVELRNELTELDVGETEGMPFAQVFERYPEFIQQWRGPDAVSVRMPGGESIADLVLRLAPFADELRARAGDREAVAVVSHNFVTRVLICLLAGVDVSRFRSFNVDLASISTIRLESEQAVIERLNDVCHLHSLSIS